ncbi:hypothetical protein EDD16DRAFT_226245 [Pisolithus croceorrhizus]|nr:hypothetical protein EDD16DRAFT_226245 [Pisolithus croceorrhizus]
MPSWTSPFASPLQQVNLLPATPPQAHSWEDDLCEAISMHREVSKRKTLVSLPKAPMTATSSPFVQTTPRDVLTERLGLDSRVTTFGHIQRGGRSCALDRIPAYLARYGSCQSASRGYARYPVLHDQRKGEQNHTCAFNRGRGNDAAVADA